jgi:hypothetical protein
MIIRQPPLLPSDKYLASLLDLSEEDYRRFRAEVASRQPEYKPGEIIAGIETLIIIGIVASVISVGLTIAASFFKPKQEKPAEIKNRTPEPDNRTTSQRFAPRYGFDSIQQPAVLGTPIPIVYANRQNLGATSSPPRPAGRYGGIRVNTQLIWSQLLSLRGAQMLRAIFLVGEGRMACLDPYGYAIGDTSLASYDLQTVSGNQNSARLTLYAALDGGRIKSSDYIAGRSANKDKGNSQDAGGPDVFALKGVGDNWTQDFCFTSKPTTTTVFGVYAHCPNNMMFRVAPRIRPTVNCYLKPKGNDGDSEVECDDDAQALAEFWVSKYAWSLFMGLIEAPIEDGIVEVGDELVYKIDKGTVAKYKIRMNEDNTDNKKRDSNGVAKLSSVGSSVAAKQHAVDENLVIGELYRVGSALAILVGRSERKPFISNADSEPVGDGNGVRYTFRIVRRGYITLYPESVEMGDYPLADNDNNVIVPPKMNKKDDFSGYDDGPRWKVASNAPQIFRCAIATISLNRPCQVFELGFRSTVGITVSGFTNFRGTEDLKEINQKAGVEFQGEKVGEGDRLNFSTMTSGVVSGPEERYSFWRIWYRKDNDCFEAYPHAFGVRSNTSQPVYNYLRFIMPSLAKLEVRCEPLTSWEIRKDIFTGKLYVLDENAAVMSDTEDGVTIYFSGDKVEKPWNEKFYLAKLEPQEEDPGHGYTDNQSMLDMWGKLAEAFVYDEVTTTVANGPEHEVVYVNCVTPNQVLAQYDKLAILGLNIRAALEWQQFSQFSVYVTGGKVVRRLLQSDTYGQSSLFPDIYRDLLRNERYGAGHIIAEDQIDKPSFIAAAQWCQDRRYFMDWVLSDSLNLRTWAADTAATMLLDLSQRDGRFALTPAIIFDTPVQVKGLFTLGNIVEDSFALEFLDEDDRQPIQASVKWREERARDNYLSFGFFPSEREVLVREADRPDTDPVESFDLSSFCTNLEHAIDFACFIIRTRRLITHSIKFQTTPDGLVSGLAAGDYIQCAIDYSYFDTFANGAILGDGTVVTARPDLMGVGTHACVTWDGSDSPVIEQNVVVGSDGKASPTGVLFTKKSSGVKLNTYKIESIDVNQDGIITIEAVHHPVNDSGFSLLGQNWTTYETDANWVIQR